MNKIKTVIRILIISIIILCGIIGFILTNKNSDNVVEIYDEMSYAKELKSFESGYYIVSECIKKYESLLINLNNVINIEEKNDIIDSLYNMTTKEYINKYNITKENLLDNLLVNSLETEVNINSISVIEGEFIDKYHAYVTANNGGEVKQFDIIVFLDRNNATFSIMQEEIQEIPTRSYDELIFVTDKIDINDDNKYDEYETQYIIDNEGGATYDIDESKVEAEEVNIQVIALSKPRTYNSEYEVSQDFDDAGWTQSKAIVERYGPIMNINTVSNYYSQNNDEEYTDFMESLGGVFAKYGGLEKVGTGDSVSLMEAQEYTYSLIWMMGFDYCAGTCYSNPTRCTCFCRSKDTSIYSAYPDTHYDVQPHHRSNGNMAAYSYAPGPMDRAMLEYKFTTNCNYTIDKVFKEAGLMTGEDGVSLTAAYQVRLGNPSSITSRGGTVVTDVSDLRFGDIIAMPGHWVYVGEETEDTITIYETGHDLTDDGDWRKVISKSADNSAISSRWIAGHFYDLTYDPSLLGGYSQPIEEDENGGILLNAIINLLTSILDAIQSFITEIMLNVDSQAASVTVSDLSLYPQLNLRSSDSKPDWWWESDTAEDSEEEETSSSGMDNSGEGVIENSNSSEESSEGESGTTIEYYVDATQYIENYKYINMLYTPEAVFSGETSLLSINFFETTNDSSVWGTLRNVVVYWFRALRYLSLAGLLSVLIYIGIKTMLTASPSKKSDYKQGIVGWIVGMIIIFLLPYIMSFLITIGDKIVDIFSSDPVSSINVYVFDGGNHENKAVYSRFSTNLMGLVRFQTQSSVSIKRVGFIILYFMLIIITIRFTFIYMKRMIYMAYLTMISPLVALMYPIDRVNSGGARGFNEWFKGYLINVLIQPIHLIVYYILVSSAMEFATKNILYTIIALGLISELENLIKSIFGLDSGGMGTVEGSENTTLGLGALATGITAAASSIGGLLSGGSNSNKKNNENNSNNNTNSNSSNNRVDYERDFNNKNEQNTSKDNQDEQNNDQENQDEQSNGGENQNEQNNEESQGENNSGERRNEGQPNNGNSPEVSENKSSKKGVLSTLRQMARRRVEKAGHNIGFRKGQGAARNALNIGANLGKRTIKGVAKGVKLAGTLAIGAGAATVQAAYSIASDGKYNPLEGITTTASVAAGAGHLMDKAGGKLSNLAKEHKKERVGQEESERIQREKDFRGSKQVYNAYEKEYSGDGKGEVQRRLNIGQKIAGQGIEDPKEQIQVMNYMDSMVDKDYQKKYANMDASQRDAEAERIRRENKDLKGLSTEETLKWNMKKNDDQYLNRAVTTSKARSEIPQEVINGSEKDWKAFVSSRSAGNEGVAKGYEAARTSIREMNAAQRRKR